VPGRIVERALLRGQRTVPGSFSDFVWVLDRHTGHVVHAELSGVVLRTLDWGLFSSEVEARIAVELDTQQGAAGFQPAQRLLGQRVRAFCREPGEDCTRVPPVPFDPVRGYVNAVGPLSARAVGVTTRIFCDLGEVRFLERAGSRPTQETQETRETRKIRNTRETRETHAVAELPPVSAGLPDLER